MTSTHELLFVVVTLAALLWIAIKATLVVCRDPLIERPQRSAQLSLVWLLPLIGPLVVLAVQQPQKTRRRVSASGSSANEDKGNAADVFEALVEGLDKD
ncbi:hypothetical protein [Viridibacterium curvum]|uniref:Uncharacterized protein n=1 Tax=Viridibacterium curvum TaxID=1101404 RepID=A0ABP9QUC2_9RHOO